MIVTTIFCSQFNLIHWLQNHLLSCPFKALTGIDCPGCGFQRSVISLLKGDLEKSWQLYPPTIPILLLFIIVAALYQFPVKKNAIIIKALIIFVGNFVMLSYLHKLFIH